MTSSGSSQSVTSDPVENKSTALLSLQAMAPDLTAEEIYHIFHDKCEQDFKQSVDFLLALKNKQKIENANEILVPITRTLTNSNDASICI